MSSPTESLPLPYRTLLLLLDLLVTLGVARCPDRQRDVLGVEGAVHVAVENLLDRLLQQLGGATARQPVGEGLLQPQQLADRVKYQLMPRTAILHPAVGGFACRTPP